MNEFEQKKKRNNWTKEEVLSDAQRYISRSVWKANSSAYYAAIRFRIYSKATAHMDYINQKNKWTKEATLADAKKYQSRSKWKEVSSSAYYASKRLAIFDEATSHMNVPPPTWTKETAIADAKKYASRSEWYSNSSAYRISLDNGWLDEAATHMTCPANQLKWTKEAILQEALKYQTRSGWREHSGGSYKAASANGWLEQATAHMGKPSNSSRPEANLLEFVKRLFPKAHRAVFGNKKGIGNSFELDIYIPELRKGIEFNGDYWHSEAGLRRGRPDWPDDMIKNYHNLKKEFFIQKDISYLEIWESEWQEDSERCLSKVEQFLGETCLVTNLSRK